MNASGSRHGHRPVVAIDGTAAAGKSTVAIALAKRMGYRYVDTGAMYRSVASAALRRGIALEDEDALQRLAESVTVEFQANEGGARVLVNGDDETDAIRDPAVSAAASRVSALPGVRTALVARQRTMSAGGGLVMEGRDIGTVVLPRADLKVFLDATPEVRAGRRYAELRARGLDVSEEDVRRQEADRDRRDATREHSPLRPATDAVVLDTTFRTPDEVVESIVAMLRERTGVS
jgi:cytidylate kinase